jgi:hypothetical protein
MNLSVRQLLSSVRDGRCQKMVKYQSRKFEFIGIDANIHGITINVGKLITELENIEGAGEIVKALDDFQSNLCNSLCNTQLIKFLRKEDRRNYANALVGAQICVLYFRMNLACLCRRC